MCLFYVEYVDFTTLPLLCRIGGFGYGSDENLLWRSRYFGNGSDRNLLGKGNSEPFLSRIDWFGHEYAEYSEQREYCALFVSHRLVSILCLFCVALVGLCTGQTKTFGTEGVTFLCRIN